MRPGHRICIEIWQAKETVIQYTLRQIFAMRELVCSCVISQKPFAARRASSLLIPCIDGEPWVGLNVKVANRVNVWQMSRWTEINLLLLYRLPHQPTALFHAYWPAKHVALIQTCRVHICQSYNTWEMAYLHAGVRRDWMQGRHRGVTVCHFFCLVYHSGNTEFQIEGLKCTPGYQCA